MEIRDLEIDARTIIDALPMLAWCTRADGYAIFSNRQWLDYSGLSAESALGWSWRDKIHPADLDTFIERWTEAAATGEPLDAEMRLLRFDGVYRWFLVRAVPLRDSAGNIVRWLGSSTDIDDRKTDDVLRAGESRILEMVASARPLSEVLEEVCSLVDRISPDSMASVLLVDSSDCLRRGAGPRFPEEFLDLVDGLKIGPAVGSCGTAAFRKEQVIVTDMETDPLWDDYREVARHFGFRAGWSTPILSSSGSVVGVFGIYWNEPRTPSPIHYHVIDQVTQLTSVAIERQRHQEAIRASEKFARGQADALTRTIDAISRESALDRIAEHILRELIAQLDAVSSSVWLLNPATGLMGFEFALEEGVLRSKTDPALAAVCRLIPVETVFPWREAFRTGKPVAVQDIRVEPEFPCQSRLLEQGVVTVLIVPMFVGGEAAGIIGIRFTQQRELHTEEIELAQALANQAMLATQLTRLSDHARQAAVLAERNRLARDVHDTIAQGLTGVIVQLEAADEAMVQSRPAQISEHIDRASTLARESLQEARRSVRALRPQALVDAALEIALKDVVTGMTAGTAISAHVTVEGEAVRLLPDCEDNLLRIGQEVLTNAVRHANPTKFQCRLSYGTREIALQLSDNGIGFDPTEHHLGFGLLGMRERVAAIGGTLTIDSGPDKGTSVTVSLPIEISTYHDDEPSK